MGAGWPSRGTGVSGRPRVGADAFGSRPVAIGCRRAASGRYALVHGVPVTIDAWIAGAIFLAAYALIAIERWDRTLIALLAGFLVVALGIIDQHEAFAAIDLNVILLLVGMMVIASILAQTGFFEWLAIRSAIRCGCC
jgi:predicted exporter